jgi:hypothetical protein
MTQSGFPWLFLQAAKYVSDGYPDSHKFIEQLQLARFRLLRVLFTLAPEELPLKKATSLLQKLDPGTVFYVQINEEALEAFGRIGECGRVQHGGSSLPQNHIFVYEVIQ